MIDITRRMKIESVTCLKEEASEFMKDCISLNTHTSSHVDFPLLMNTEGKSSSDYNIDDFVGSCYVKDCTYLNHRVLKRDLQAINFDTYDFILFKTKNSEQDHFSPDYIYLAEEAALYLATKKLKGVGIDGISIEREQEGHPSHKILLEQDILVLEGLNLSSVEEGVYELFALPMKIENGTCAPLRAMIRK